MRNFIRRLRVLWLISGINVEGYEYETQRKKIINKLTDILKPEDSPPLPPPKRLASIIYMHSQPQDDSSE